MEQLLERYKSKKPEVVFEWNDEETGAEGWVVINSLRGGAAGGGTRMREGLTKEEVVSLAKVMEIKFSVCGPNIGGAKSGINFNPKDPRRNEVLRRWYKAVMPLLKMYYGTGGDLNVDELTDVIPITEDLGLWHPQEGIVRGHLKPDEGQKINIIGQLRHGCSKIVEDPDYAPEGNGKKYAVADLITGYGVAQSIKHFYSVYKKEELEGKTVLIQGWGNVASAAACYLAKDGVKLKGIIDIDHGLVSEKGLGLEEVKKLFLEKKGNKLYSEDMQVSDELQKSFWDVGADVFIPGAASKLVTKEQVERMIKGGLEVISCGANVPFVDDKVFFGETAKWADKKVAIIPDFIANSGMARVFAYLMTPEVELTDRAIFEDVSSVIRKSLKDLHEINEKPYDISTNALYLSLKKLSS